MFNFKIKNLDLIKFKSPDPTIGIWKSTLSVLFEGTNTLEVGTKMCSYGPSQHPKNLLRGPLSKYQKSGQVDNTHCSKKFWDIFG